MRDTEPGTGTGGGIDATTPRGPPPTRATASLPLSWARRPTPGHRVHRAGIPPVLRCADALDAGAPAEGLLQPCQRVDRPGGRPVGRPDGVQLAGLARCGRRARADGGGRGLVGRAGTLLSALDSEPDAGP